MEFKETNLNPTGKKVGDCVVRAIMFATKKTWPETYQALCELGLKFRQMPNSKKVYQHFLETEGWTKQKMPRFPDNTRYTLKEFADKNNKGTYIISVAHHLTVIENGVLVDTWDCSYKSVGNYWSK